MLDHYSDFIQTGSSLAFTKIFKNNQPRLIEYCTAILRNRQLAKDVTQQVFLKLLTNQPRLDHTENLPGYLMVCAKNICLNHLRTREYDSNVDVEELLQSDDSPIEHLIRQEDETEIHKAIAVLSEKERDLFWRRAVDDIPYTDLSTELGIPNQTLRVQFHRTRSKLKKLVA